MRVAPSIVPYPSPQNKSQRLEIYKQWLSNNVNNYSNLEDTHSENLMKMITNEKIVEAEEEEPERQHVHKSRCHVSGTNLQWNQ